MPPQTPNTKTRPSKTKLPHHNHTNPPHAHTLSHTHYHIHTPIAAPPRYSARSWCPVRPTASAMPSSPASPGTARCWRRRTGTGCVVMRRRVFWLMRCTIHQSTTLHRTQPPHTHTHNTQQYYSTPLVWAGVRVGGDAHGGLRQHPHPARGPPGQGARGGRARAAVRSA